MSTEEVDDRLVVRMSGDFDLLAVEPFAIEVERAIAAAQHRVVVDLRQLAFIDSSGLRALLAGYERFAAAGLDVAFLPPPEPLWRVLEVTGTDGLLPFADAAESEIGPPAPSGA